MRLLVLAILVALNQAPPRGAEVYKPMTHEQLFDLDYAELRDVEGGLANDPADPGGETAYGISRVYHGDDFGQWPPTPAEARLWFRDRWEQWRVVEIRDGALRRQYWLFAVNAGDGDAVLALQCAMRGKGYRIELDGNLGPKTRRALFYSDQGALLEGFRAAVYSHYAKQKQFPLYSKTWLRRVDPIRE